MAPVETKTVSIANCLSKIATADSNIRSHQLLFKVAAPELLLMVPTKAAANCNCC